MARVFNRSIRPVQSIKHVVDTATTAVPAGLVSTVPIIISNDDPSNDLVTQVQTGSTVNSFYLRIEMLHNSGTWVTVPRLYMSIQKNPGNNLNTVYPANVGPSDNKKWIIHQEMMMTTGIAADDNSFPRTMFQGVIKIPRGYKRNGTADRMNINFSLDVMETTATVTVCVQCIYREYR